MKLLFIILFLFTYKVSAQTNIVINNSTNITIIINNYLTNTSPARKVVTKISEEEYNKWVRFNMLEKRRMAAFNQYLRRYRK